LSKGNTIWLTMILRLVLQIDM